jgi:hypothetical protein
MSLQDVHYAFHACRKVNKNKWYNYGNLHLAKEVREKERNNQTNKQKIEAK